MAYHWKALQLLDKKVTLEFFSGTNKRNGSSKEAGPQEKSSIEWTRIIWTRSSKNLNSWFNSHWSKAGTLPWWSFGKDLLRIVDLAAQGFLSLVMILDSPKMSSQFWIHSGEGRRCTLGTLPWSLWVKQNLFDFKFIPFHEVLRSVLKPALWVGFTGGRRHRDVWRGRCVPVRHRGWHPRGCRVPVWQPGRRQVPLHQVRRVWSDPLLKRFRMSFWRFRFSMMIMMLLLMVKNLQKIWQSLMISMLLLMVKNLEWIWKSLPSLKSLVLPTLPPPSKRAWNQVLQNSLSHYYSIKAQINLLLHVILII